MKKKLGLLTILILSIFIISSSLSGCATSRATAASGTTGAIVGGATGFVIGALTGGPIGAIIGTAAGIAIGYGVGYATGKYIVTREGGVRGISMLNLPYKLASNKVIYDPASRYPINFKEIKGVLVSNLKIYTIPKIIKAGENIKLIMLYNILGTKHNIKNSSVIETRVLEGINGKIYYNHTSTTGISREGVYKTQLNVKIPKSKIPAFYIYEATVKVNNALTALSSKLIMVK
jgi:hypothetical protein